VLPRRHRVVAVIACVVVPATARLLGRGTFAWGMFAGTDEYRVRIVAHDRSGRAWFVAPTELASIAGQNAAVFFSGSDHFRRVAGADVVRRHLDEVASRACVIAPAADEIELQLQHRERDNAPVATSSTRVRCR